MKTKLFFTPFPIVLLIVLILIVFSTGNLYSSNLDSPTADFETHFKDGLSKFESSKFQEAKKSFEDALQEDSNNVAALVNLGLTSWHLNQKGEALGFVRRALYLNPSDAPATLALEFMNEKFQVREIPHTNSIWENFRQTFLLKLPLPLVLSAALITFFIGAWFMIENIARRKKALNEDLVPPSFSWISAIILIISLKLWVLSFCKTLDENSPRGTIVVEKVNVRAGPGENEAQLFELFEGNEVLILRVDGDWAQIQFPGAFTGWIPQTSIFQNFGKNLVLTKFSSASKLGQ